MFRRCALTRICPCNGIDNENGRNITTNYVIIFHLFRLVIMFCCFRWVFISPDWIVDFSISLDAETVIDAPLLDIYVFFLCHGYYCSNEFGRRLILVLNLSGFVFHSPFVLKLSVISQHNRTLYTAIRNIIFYLNNNSNNSNNDNNKQALRCAIGASIENGIWEIIPILLFI